MIRICIMEGDLVANVTNFEDQQTLDDWLAAHEIQPTVVAHEDAGINWTIVDGVSTPPPVPAGSEPPEEEVRDPVAILAAFLNANPDVAALVTPSEP